MAQTVPNKWTIQSHGHMHCMNITHQWYELSTITCTCNNSRTNGNLLQFSN